MDAALKRRKTPSPCTGTFQAQINQHPFLVTSVAAGLKLRPELSQVPDHWIWRVVADGKVGSKRASIGLFIDYDLGPGTYRLPSDPRVKVVFSQTPHGRSVIYHSAQLQAGRITLIEADVANLRLKGTFEFSISAVGFAVTQGAFDLLCR